MAGPSASATAQLRVAKTTFLKTARDLGSLLDEPTVPPLLVEDVKTLGSKSSGNNDLLLVTAWRRRRPVAPRLPDLSPRDSAVSMESLI